MDLNQNNNNISQSRINPSRRISIGINQRRIQQQLPQPFIDIYTSINESTQNSNEIRQSLFHQICTLFAIQLRAEIQSLTNRFVEIVLNQAIRFSIRRIGGFLRRIIPQSERIRRARELQSHSIEMRQVSHQSIQSFPVSFFDEVQYLEHNTVPQISTEPNVLEPEVVSISDQVQPLSTTNPSVQTTVQIPLYIPSPILSSHTTRIRRAVPCQDDTNTSPTSIGGPLRYISEYTPELQTLDIVDDTTSSLELSQSIPPILPPRETELNDMNPEIQPIQRFEIQSDDSIESISFTPDPIGPDSSPLYADPQSPIYTAGLGIIARVMDSKIKCGVYANSLQQIALGIHFNPTLHKFPASTSYPNGLGLYFSLTEAYRNVSYGFETSFANTLKNWELECVSHKALLGRYEISGFLRFYPNAQVRLHGSIGLNSSLNEHFWQRDPYIATHTSLSFGLPIPETSLEKLQKQLSKARHTVRDLQNKYDTLESQHTEEILSLQSQYQNALNEISSLSQKVNTLSNPNTVETLRSELSSTQQQLQGCLVTLQKTARTPEEQDISEVFDKIRKMGNLPIFVVPWNEFLFGIGLGLVIEFSRFICRGIRDRSLNRRVKIWCSFFLYLFPTGFVGISIFIYMSNGIINCIQNRAFFAPNSAIEALYTPGQYIENGINTKLAPLDTLANLGIHLLNIALRCILLLNIVCLGIPYTPTLFQQKFTLFVQPYIQPFILKTSYALFWRILGAYLVTWLSGNYAQYQRK